ncbi:MAG TPA: glutathione S-transferase C-terminal domain-containing protein, partial [Methylotenera sp.]|nr:glutathione S-transferase C-terminal domain-containing protein [Methylotenera sp.]
KYLLNAEPSLADIAIFPFVRQFAGVDSAWFEQSDYPKLRAWLNEWVDSDLFKSIMTKNPTFID